MKAELISYMGSDDMVVDAARVSFQKEASNYTSEQNEKLIKYLAAHNHFSPFTHPQITLREKVPIFVARQRFKHTVGFTYNEVSRRYVDGIPEFYIPSVWRSKPEGSIKQGSGKPHELSGLWLDTYKTTMHNLVDLYNDMIEGNIAPEQARMVLPQSLYTEYYVTGSLAAFARAYKLRSDSHSQIEIQELSKEWDRIIKSLFPVSWRCLIE